MSQPASASRTPSLRFSEFSGEWEEKSLYEISSDVMYGIGSAATEFDGVNKYLRITDIDEETRKFKIEQLTSPEGEIDQKYKLCLGDLVFARTGASVGKSYLYDENDGNLIFAGFLIKFHIVGAVPYFVFLQTFRSIYDKWVKTMSMRSGQPGLNAEEYKSLLLNYPLLPEQTKIAAFLSSVDTKIDQLSQKKTLLEQYKKGVMQKIFSQKIRFKADDSSDYPEWEEKKLGDVYFFGATNSLSRASLNDDAGQLRNIHYGDIHTKFPTLLDASIYSLPFVSDLNELNENQKSFLCKVGDVVFADASEDYKDVGKAIELIKLPKEPIVSGLHTIVARPTLKNMAIGFSGYLMTSSHIRKQIMTMAVGAKVLGI